MNNCYVFAMKFVLFFFFVAVCYACPSPCDWKTFKEYYGRKYANPTEEKFHRKVFERNKKMVERHNRKYDKGRANYMMYLNHFSDRTAKELKYLRRLWPGGVSMPLP